MKLRRKISPNNGIRDNYVGDDSVYVSGALSLLLRLSRWAGAAPLHIQRAGAGWHVTVSPTLATLQKSVITLLYVTGLTGIILDLCQERKQQVYVGLTFVEGLIWISNFMLSILVTSFAVYAGRARMESLMQVLKLWQQIKSDLNISDPPPKTEKIKSTAIVVLMVWTTTGQLIIFGLNLYSMVHNTKSCIIMILYGATSYLLKIPGVLVSMQWCLTVLVARAAAAAINDNLRRLFYESKFELPSHAQAKIRCLTLSNERLSEMIREMNNANGWVVMAILASASFQLMRSTYKLYLTTLDTRHQNLNWLFYVIMFVFLASTHITILLLMIEPCHITQTQRNYTEVLLSQLIVHLAPESERLSKELDQFANQLALDNGQFMPLGVYTLGRPLMAMILGGITTYLVIVIHFHNVQLA